MRRLAYFFVACDYQNIIAQWSANNNNNNKKKIITFSFRVTTMSERGAYI